MGRSIAFWVFIALWLGWLLPFAVRKRSSAEHPVVKAKSARWGMFLQGIGFFFAWLHRPSWWPPSSVRMGLSIALAMLACFIGISAAKSLGKQWRFDAALNRDHNLIQSGPYAFVRHPIYASMLAMLVATALMMSHWIALFVALVFYFAGTEIRVRVEERLLRSRFGSAFDEYCQRVPAYLPGVR